MSYDHFNISSSDKKYEFDLYQTEKGIQIGGKFYSIKPKNSEDLTAITDILKGIGEINSLDELTNNIKLLSS